MNSKHFVLGGDINKSLTEGYQLDLKKIGQDAFVITRKNIIPLLSACMLILFGLMASFVLFLDESTSLQDTSVMVLFLVLSLLVAPPLITGLLMMGINHAIGLKTKSIHLFNYFPIAFKLSLAAMMVNLITNVISVLFSQLGGMGVALSVIALLYFNMSFCLVYPLIAEKKVSPMNALTLSFKLVHKNLGQFTILLMISCLLFALGALTSGIAFLFIIPFMINAMGIIYRQICGVTISVTEVPEGEQSKEDDDDSAGPTNGGFEA